jgi:hypothetical protein
MFVFLRDFAVVPATSPVASSTYPDGYPDYPRAL